MTRFDTREFLNWSDDQKNKIENSIQSFWREKKEKETEKEMVCQFVLEICLAGRFCIRIILNSNEHETNLIGLTRV